MEREREKERGVTETQSCSIAIEFLIIFVRNHTLFLDNECDTDIKETSADYLCPVI